MNTLCLSLAKKIRDQAEAACALLELATAGDKDRTGLMAGIPADVLTVRGHIADIGLSNELFGVRAGLLDTSMPDDIMAFLNRREAMTADEAANCTTETNEAMAFQIEQLTDDDLSREATDVFTGETGTLLDVLLHVIEHHGVHLGKARQILHAAGV